MSIQFHCPGCNFLFNAPEHLAGTQASCNQCQMIVTIPAVGASPGAQSPMGAAARPSVMQASAPTSNPVWTPPAGQPHAAPAPFPTQPQSISKPAATLSPAMGSGVPVAVWYMVGGSVALVMLAMAYMILFGGESTPSNDPANSAVAGAPGAGTVASSPPSSPSSRPFRIPAGSATTSPAPSTSSGRWESKSVGNSNPTSTSRPNPSSPQVPTSNSSNSRPQNPSLASTPTSTSSSTPGGGQWGNGSLKIPVKRQSDICFGPIGCPVVVVKDEVWHLEQKRVVAELDEADTDERGLSRLSGDGLWFCRASKSPNQEDTSITIWKTATGKVSCVIPGDPENYADFIEFSRDKYLLVGGRSTPVIKVFEVSTGEEMPSITVPTRRVEDDTTTFSPKGDYFTAVMDNQLLVFNTLTKKRAAVMERPQAIAKPGEELNDLQKRMRDDAVMRDIEIVRFSPDGQELVAISDTRAPRLLCWNNRGKLVVDELIPAVSHRFFFDPMLDWLPDQSGWIVSGHVFDRESRRLVVTLRTEFAVDPLFFPMDRERLLGTLPHDPNTLKVVRLPWDKIEQSLAGIASGAPAILAPGQPVGLKMQLSNIRGDQVQTSSMIQNAFVKRLERDGLRVGANEQTYFQLRFSEQAGDTLPIYERQSPFDFRGSNTGRTATEAKGAMVIELISAGKVLWRDSIKARSSSSFREEINDANIRKSMLHDLSRSMNDLGIPYYMPASPDAVALPMVME